MRIFFLIVANLLGLCEITAQDIVFNKIVYDLGTFPKMKTRLRLPILLQIKRKLL